MRIVCLPEIDRKVFARRQSAAKLTVSLLLDKILRRHSEETSPSHALTKNLQQAKDHQTLASTVSSFGARLTVPDGMPAPSQ